LQLAGELRAAGLRVEVYPEPLRNGKDLGKAFKYADARQARFATVLGHDELSRGDVKIKNLQTGEQQTVARHAVASTVRQRTPDLDHRPSDSGHRPSDTALLTSDDLQ
jgi:histidyl-tRNA synthetase